MPTAELKSLCHQSCSIGAIRGKTLGQDRGASLCTICAMEVSACKSDLSWTFNIIYICWIPKAGAGSCAPDWQQREHRLRSGASISSLWISASDLVPVAALNFDRLTSDRESLGSSGKMLKPAPSNALMHRTKHRIRGCLCDKARPPICTCFGPASRFAALQLPSTPAELVRRVQAAVALCGPAPGAFRG